MKEEKKNTIKETLQKTRLKRKLQICKVYELKIDVSHLNKKEQEILKMFFVEAKWLYNFVLSQEDVFKYDYKVNPIQSMNKNKELEEKQLKYLPAKNRQNIVSGLQQNIINLAKAKKKGLKIGRLKFKSSYNSIDLSQYGTTHKIVSGNKIKINGIKRHLRVRGLKQIKEEYEIANAKLIKKASGYYIKLTCFEFKKEVEQKDKKEIGIDFGIKTSITTSEGDFFNISIGENEHLKTLQRKFARQTKGSNNWYKTKIKIQKEYEYIANQRKDKANKIVSFLDSNYIHIYMQDESIKGWHKGLFGKQVQNSALGSIKSKLLRLEKVTIIDKWFPTTKMCYQCGAINTIDLSERIYRCDCGLEEDRDIKAAKTILLVGQNKISTEHRKFKPAEKMLDFVNSFEFSKQFSMKQEATQL